MTMRDSVWPMMNHTPPPGKWLTMIVLALQQATLCPNRVICLKLVNSAYWCAQKPCSIADKAKFSPLPYSNTAFSRHSHKCIAWTFIAASAVNNVSVFSCWSCFYEWSTTSSIWMKRPTLTKSTSSSSSDKWSGLVAPRDDGKSPRGQDWGPPGALLRLYILHRGLAMCTLDQMICYATWLLHESYMRITGVSVQPCNGIEANHKGKVR